MEASAWHLPPAVTEGGILYGNIRARYHLTQRSSRGLPPKPPIAQASTQHLLQKVQQGGILWGDIRTHYHLS